MESNLSSFNFSVLLIDFISNQDDGDVVANSSQIFVPFGNVFIGDSSSDIKHKNSGIGSNVITLSQTTEFFLTCSIPDTELNGSMISIEDN